MADIDISNLEPNSHKYKREKEAKKEREKVKPIVKKDQIVSTKKPIGKKFAETFLSEGTDDVKHWVITDVLIPGIQNTILDILSMMFFGETRSRDRRSRRDRDDKFNYRGCYNRDSDRYDRSRNRRRDSDDYYDSDDRVDFRNIVLRHRDDAEHVVESMRGRIREYGSASIGELLDLLDIAGRYTDNNWGWDDERDIRIRRVSSGFLIDVSEPIYLD